MVDEGLCAGILHLAQLQHLPGCAWQWRPGKNPPAEWSLLQIQSKATQNPAHFKLTNFEAWLWKARKAAGSPGKLLQVCPG